MHLRGAVRAGVLHGWSDGTRQKAGYTSQVRRFETNTGGSMSAVGHVWTAPWQELSDVFCSIGRVRSRVRPVGAAGVAAGPNALRGSGPNRSPALESALTQTGSPEPRTDRICITSSCPRQFVETPSLCCWQQPGFPERFCADHQRPGHASNLVGKCNGGDLDWPARHDTRKPEPPRTVLPCISDNGHGACNEQPSQIPISLL